MRLCLNRENNRFKEIVSTKTYVDKTGLLDLLNERISTDDKLVAVSFDESSSSVFIPNNEVRATFVEVMS